VLFIATWDPTRRTTGISARGMEEGLEGGDSKGSFSGNTGDRRGFLDPLYVYKALQEGNPNGFLLESLRGPFCSWGTAASSACVALVAAS